MKMGRHGRTAVRKPATPLPRDKAKRLFYTDYISRLQADASWWTTNGHNRQVLPRPDATPQPLTNR